MFAIKQIFVNKDLKQLQILLISSFCLFSGLSIAASRVALVPILVLWLITVAKNKQPRVHENDLIIVPLICLLLINTFSSVTGVDVAYSFGKLAKIALHYILPFAVAASLRGYTRDQSLKQICSYFGLLCFGQAIAAIYTILEHGVAPFDLGPPGAVTESGQLVLIIPVIWVLAQLRNASQESKQKLTTATASALIAIALIVFCWADTLTQTLRFNPRIFAAIIVIISGIVLWQKARRLQTIPILSNPILMLFIGSLLFAALVLNLKRGPWIGVFIECLILGLLISRPFAGITLFGGSFALLLPPVQERLLQSLEHFTISGGRQTMWEIALDLIRRFPLGLGTGNAHYMQKLDPSIPDTHRHMHSNFLNILVENGWVGFAAYLWFFAVVLLLGYRVFRKLQSQGLIEESYIALACTAALFGWQVAGLVEYNFGDGEIRLIALLLLGVLLHLNERAATQR